MKKILLFIFPIILAFIVFLIIQFFVNRTSGKGVLQVTSNPKSTVYLNGKAIGQTPLCKGEVNDMINIGEYTVRLVPVSGSFSPFEEKIKISKSVLTVVDRTFGSGATSDGSVISLSPLDNSKGMELLVISFPDNAQVMVDGNSSGRTPISIKDLTESDHEVKIIKDGYKEKSIKIRMVLGYKLLVEAFLGINQEAISIMPTITPSVNPSLSLTPSFKRVLILQTPTGFLRVRNDASLGSAEIARVLPGEIYDLLDEQVGWFKIKLKDGTVGWISSQYAQKQ